MADHEPAPPRETRSERWRRRRVSIPAMLGVTAVALALAPLIALGLAASDLALGRMRMPKLRVFGVALQYLVNDSIEILLAPLLWLFAGFGTRLHSPASVRRHARLQRWSIDLLARRAERLLGVRVEVSATSGALDSAPAVVLCRHVSLLDASLPALVYAGKPDIELRGVIMAEMLADPGFDLLYARSGSIFIPRERGPRARAAVRELGRTLDSGSVGVIYPEGRLFSPERLQRSLARLAESDSERAGRLRELGCTLPPHLGGVQSMLEGASTADVVVIMHTGLEHVPSLHDLARHAPLRHVVRAQVQRFDRSGVPADPTELQAWMDDRWLEGDAWVRDQQREPTRVAEGRGRFTELRLGSDPERAGTNWRSQPLSTRPPPAAAPR